VERNVHDPFTPEQERECRWYLEEYATRNPFEEGRARRFTQFIKNYAQDLFDQLDMQSILPSHNSKPDKQLDLLTIEIVALANTDRGSAKRPALHRLHWELLETPDLWDSSISNVAVVRKVVAEYSPMQDLSQDPPFPSDSAVKQTYNILLVISRDLREHDDEALPDSVLNALLRVQSALEALSDRLPLSVEVVRPGTFTALEQHLQQATLRHGPGYFDLVHFDMHGVVKMVIQGSKEK
jgi:hypothetical protein